MAKTGLVILVILVILFIVSLLLLQLKSEFGPKHSDLQLYAKQTECYVDSVEQKENYVQWNVVYKLTDQSITKSSEIREGPLEYKGEVEEALGRYKVGQSYACYYNERRPFQVMFGQPDLKKPLEINKWNNALWLIPQIYAAIVGGGIILICQCYLLSHQP